MSDHVDYLKSLDACDEAVEWAATQPSLKQAWRVCKRGDWMLWLAARRGVPLSEIVLAACQCARLALPYVPVGEERPRRAIEVAEAWARGEEGVMLEDVRDTARASYAASYVAYASRAGLAAASAAYAAHVAYAAAYAAYAYAASSAVVAAAATSDKPKTLAECATICRRMWPTLPGEE